MKANELVTTAVEGATVLKATAMASHVLCTCIPQAALIERERQDKFVAAVRAYEWEVAEILAMSADEFQDVADSKRRVLAMLEAQRRLWDASRIVVEPSAVAALAALTSGAYVPEKDERVAVLLCGANAEPDWFMNEA